MSHTHHNSEGDHKYCSHQLDLKKKKTAWVLLISLLTMILEISFGYITNSMALLSDGWHMFSHVFAIGASWLAYKYVIRQKSKVKSVDTAKSLSYVGLFNAVALVFVAVHVIVECVERFNHPLNIQYREAIVVAVIGLIVNLLSAKILHHNEEQSDQNLRAAYLHILTDILTSALALVALIIGLYWGVSNIDSIVGIVGALVILNWSRSSITSSIKEIKHEKASKTYTKL